MKILVADDEAMVLNIVIRLLEFMGHEVLSAESGTSALALLREHDDLDLAILDQNMPDITGIEVLKELRQFRPNLYVLISSGERSLRLDDPKSGLLEKPFRLDELQKKLAAVPARAT